MCGIAGFIENPQKFNARKAVEVVRCMTKEIRHRGPDTEGIWTDGSCVAMAHRRLSIIDLSCAGNQPMISTNDRYVIVFNGEIYNHNELRNQLNYYSWRGHSDTETLLAATEAWGIREALRRSEGMFALAIWLSLIHI